MASEKMTWLLFASMLVSFGCQTTQESERPTAILAPSGDDCVSISDRFYAAIHSAGLRVTRERVNGATILSAKYSPEKGDASEGDSAGDKDKKDKAGEETYYLVIKTQTPQTAEWNGVLHGDVSTCMYKRQVFDVILKMAE